MSIKLLVNGEAGSGKTDLLRSFTEDMFVVSRDAKKFSLPIPHMMVEEWTDMASFIKTIKNKIEAYEEKFEKYPTVIAIDTVSQITMDVIDKASQTPNVYGSQGAEITKEMGLFTKFIHEYLEMNGMTVLLLNHVIPEKDEGKNTGSYVQFGQGKFLAKGGFYSTTNESVTLVPEGKYRAVYTRGVDKQARTTINSTPEKFWVENTVDPKKSKKLKAGEVYFNLKDYVEMLIENQTESESWSL